MRLNPWRGRPTPPSTSPQDLLHIFLEIYEVLQSFTLPLFSFFSLHLAPHPHHRHYSLRTTDIAQISQLMADSACTGSRRGRGTVLILENISDQLDFISLPLMAHMQRLKAAYNDPDAAVCYLCWSWTPSIQTLERIHIVLLKRSRNSRLLTDIFFFFFVQVWLEEQLFRVLSSEVCVRVCVYELLNMCAPRGIFDLWFLFFWFLFLLHFVSSRPPFSASLWLISDADT